MNNNLHTYTRARRRFLADASGNVAVVAAIAVVPLLIGAGMAVDYSKGVGVTRDLQVSADGAALAALASGETDQSQLTTIANEYFDANFSGLQPGMQPTVSVSFSGDTITVTANTPVQTSFMTLAGISTMDSDATATAKRMPGDPVCLLSLDPSSASAFEAQGSATMNTPGCTLHTNSDHANGLNSHTTTPITADAFCSVGGYTGTAFNPLPKTNCPSVDDPFADLPWPTITGCDETNRIVHNETAALSPGTYCGGLKLQTHSVVTFAPGTYVMDGGAFTMGAHSQASGNGVVFVMMGDDTSVQLNSSADVDLTAPSTGDYTGILFAQHPTSNPGEENDIQGGASMNLVGTLYFPTQIVDLGGGGDLHITASHTPLVAYGMRVRGNSFTASIDDTLFPGTGNIAEINKVIRLTK